MSELQHRYARQGALLLAIGVATGAVAAGAMTGKLPASGGAALAAHLNGILGGFWLLLYAWSLPMLRYGVVGARRVGTAILVAAWANWLITLVKAFLHVSGLAYTSEPANNAIAAGLQLFVVAPSLLGSFAWAWGFRRVPVES